VEVRSQSRSHLDDSEVSAYWRQISQSLSRLLDEMDHRDTWAIDSDPAFLDLLSRLVELMENETFAASIERGDNAARMAEVLALLKTSRFMRVLEMFDKRQPGVVNRLVLALARLGGEGELFASLFYERLLNVHRAELLGQVFSVSRGERIAQDVQMVKEIM
jgi:hypothetical protein